MAVFGSDTASRYRRSSSLHVDAIGEPGRRIATARTHLNSKSTAL